MDKKNNATNESISFWMCILILSILLILSASIAQSIPKSTAIRNVRIFDGARVIPRGTVLLKDGKIKEVGKDVTIPDDVRLE